MRREQCGLALTSQFPLGLKEPSIGISASRPDERGIP